MKRTKHLTALAVLAVALGGCIENEKASDDARTLQQMLALGANQELIDKYDAIGDAATRIRRLPENVRRAAVA